MGHDNHNNPAKQVYNLTVGDDIKAALDAIVDSSIAKPYVVYVNAGVYSIGNNVLTIPAYVTLQALGGDVILDYTGNTTQVAVSLSSGSKLVGVGIQNHLSSSYAIEILAAGSYVIDDVTFIDVSRCILINHASARPTIRRPVFLPFGAAMVAGIKCESGTPAIYELRTGGNLAITDLVWVTGASSHAHLFGLFSEETGVVNSLRASAAGRLEANELIIKNATKGSYVESGGILVMRAGVLNLNDYGMDITGAGSTFQGFNVSFLDSVISNYRAGAGTLSLGYGISDPGSFDIDPDAQLQASFITTTPEDEALAILAELHVGSPTFPHESSFGGGDSYVNGMKVYTYDASLTTFTDETVAAKSPSASTFTMGVDIDDAIYCGSAVPISATDFHQFYGIKFKNTVVAALGAGDIVAEYYSGATGSITAFADFTPETGVKTKVTTSTAHGLWVGNKITITGTTSYNGTFVIDDVTDTTFVITTAFVANDATGTFTKGWNELPTMTVEGDANKLATPPRGYYRRDGQVFATVEAGSYQMLFDPRMSRDWTKNDPMTLGTDYHWVRFRVVTAITTAPTLEQIKLHTDRAEFNDDGFREMFGNARAYVGIPVFWNSFQDVAGSTIADQDLFRSLNCKAGFINNVFNSDGDTIGTAFPLPRWIDTSAPLRVEVAVVPDAAVTGDLTMKAHMNSSKDGNIIQDSIVGLTATGERTTTVTKAVVAEQQQTFIFDLDISEYGEESADEPAEIIWLNIEAFTRPGNIYGISFLVKGLQFRDGEHF